jgi:hypothetical protein
VHDRGDLLAQARRGLGREPEPGLLDVAGHGSQALMARQPLGCGTVVFGAHERVHGTVLSLQKARQDLPPHEARGAGEKHGAHVTSLSRAARG